MLIRKNLSIILIAYSLSVALLLASTTFPYAPLPNSDIMWKSLIEIFFCGSRIVLEFLMLLQGDWGSLFDEMNEEDLWIRQELIDDKVVEEEDADEMNDTEEDIVLYYSFLFE